MPSVEVCQQYCFNNSDCVSFTWHKDSPELESMLCELFPSIGDPTQCSDCISGPKSCTCSNNVICSLHEDYLLDMVKDVSTEEQCQELCRSNPQCSWYTWHSSQAWPFVNTCSLLTQCSDMREVVDGSVVSGLADCTNQSIYPEPCSNYATLDSFTRNVNVPNGQMNSVCGASYCCDQVSSSYHPSDWVGESWYRFSGSAGTKMPETPTVYYKCGTGLGSWLSGGHPAPGEGQVTRTVYFDDGGSQEYHTDIFVINCGGFFVYHLCDTPVCTIGYCGQ